MTKVPRIVTLLPSATEIVCALGFEDQLVGRSHECDFPRSVVRVPGLTAAVEDLNEPHTSLHEPPRRQAEFPERPRHRPIQAVELSGSIRFA